MTASPLNHRAHGPRKTRGIVAVLALMAYLFSGVLHGLCDLDVTSSSPQSMAAVVKATGPYDRSDSAIVADHHCHGCFSASVVAPMMASRTIAPSHDHAARPIIMLDGRSPGLDPPPPKTLT